LPNVGLVLFGSADEWERSDRCSRHWSGPKLNLCGLTSPRESGAILQEAILFLGHDSGPMHLAATVGTPCVSIFSARSLPGQWFPRGPDHGVIYHQTDCFGCALDVCTSQRKKCILSITVEEVLEEVRKRLDHALGATARPHLARNTRSAAGLLA
jgi:ADP-heptose:LPS heptosyltransferase